MSGELPDLPGLDGLDLLRLSPSGVPVPTPAAFGGYVDQLVDLWLDPVAGNDSWPGTQAQPLKTYRLGVSPRLDGKVLGRSVTIHQLGSVPVTDTYWALTYQGFSTTVEFGNTLSSTVRFVGENLPVLAGPATVTAAVSGTASARAQVTVPGISFTGLANKRIRVISGPNAGLVAWVQAVVSPTVAWINQGYNLLTVATNTNIGVGDVIVVEQVHAGPLIAGRHQPSTTNYSFYFESLEWVNVNNSAFRFFDPGPWMWAAGCRFNCAWMMLTIWSDFYGCDIAASGTNALLATGRVELSNCNLAIQQQTGGYMVWSRCSQAATRFAILNGVWVPTNYVTFWDWPSSSAVEVRAGGSVNALAVVGGTSAAAGTYGIRVRGGSSYIYAAAGQKPTVAGAAAFAVEVGGTTFTYANVPATSQVPARMAGICLA